METFRHPDLTIRASFADALPDGSYVAVAGDHMETSWGPIGLLEGSTPGFVRMSPFGFGGQGSNFHGLLEWSPTTGWVKDTSQIPTPYGVIYALDGTRHVWVGGPHRSSQGYRYVTPQGLPVLGDETILLNNISEWIDLSETQDRSLLIGQGHANGGVMVWTNGTLRVLDDGLCFHINAKRDGQKVSIAYIKGPEARIHWMTIGDLMNLPIQSTETERIPMPDLDFTEIALSAATRIDREDPRLIQENSKASCGLFTEKVAWFLHNQDPSWGHVGKAPGQNQVNGHAVDAIMRRDSTEVWDLISNAGDGPGLARVVAIPKGPTGQPWKAPEMPQDAPGPIPEPDPGPTPCPDCERLQEGLEGLLGEIQVLRSTLDTLRVRVEDLESKPAPLYDAIVTEFPRRGNPFGLHTHGVVVEIRPR